MYDVILSLVRESLLPWKRNKYYIVVCARLRACTQTCGRVHARACERVPLLIQHVTCMRHIVTSFVTTLAP
jgi:hypothetical protein